MIQIITVNDELVFEVREEAVAMARERIGALMSGAAELSVPLKVELGEGNNWGEAH